MLFCFEKLTFFSINPIFLILWEIFLLQSHSAASFLPLGIFEKKQVFFLEKSIYLWRKNQNLNVSRNFVFSVAFYGTILTFSEFKKVEFFFQKTHMFFQTAKILHVLRNFTFSVVFTATFLPWNFCGSKKTQYFVSKNPANFFKETIFKARKKFNISVAFCSKVATFDDFLNCENFSGKPSNFFQQKPLF